MECRLCRLAAEVERVTPFGTLRLCVGHARALDQDLEMLGVHWRLMAAEGPFEQRPVPQGDTLTAVRVSCRFGPDDVGLGDAPAVDGAGAA